VCQSYFTWYTFFVTFNGLALGWIFGNPRSDRPGLNYLFFLFAMWNAIGAVATVAVVSRIIQSGKRIQSILGQLNSDQDQARNPSPLVLLKVTFTLTTVTLVSLLVFWIYLSSTRPTTQV
jgi:hypothetical protein